MLDKPVCKDTRCEMKTFVINVPDFWYSKTCRNQHQRHLSVQEVEMNDASYYFGGGKDESTSRNFTTCCYRPRQLRAQMR